MVRPCFWKSYVGGGGQCFRPVLPPSPQVMRGTTGRPSSKTPGSRFAKPSRTSFSVTLSQRRDRRYLSHIRLWLHCIRRVHQNLPRSTACWFEYVVIIFVRLSSEVLWSTTLGVRVVVRNAIFCLLLSSISRTIFLRTGQNCSELPLSEVVFVPDKATKSATCFRCHGGGLFSRSRWRLVFAVKVAACFRDRLPLVCA